MSLGIPIPAADVIAALESAITVLAQTSQEHANEIGRYIRKAFEPNHELVPFGVAIMYHTGCSDLEQKMLEVSYPPMLATMVSNIVLAELRKLPGVDDVFQQADSFANNG
jgi:hypothetical protein